MSDMIMKAVENHRDLILAAQKKIWENPESGYKEIKTSKYMEEVFESFGYELIKADGIPGFYTVIDTGRPGPEILVLGELDSLICPEHPDADPDTGAVHCCGHNAQCAALLGLAAALKEPGMLEGLSGRIRLCAVPAEELIEVEYRNELKKKGKIRYLGGKTEFLYRGYFEGVDMALMVHTSCEKENFYVNRGNGGFIAKRVIYKGVSAQAGGSPWNGCNALYAATLGLSAINAIRETFREPDLIRVHPIISQSDGVVNAIPDCVVLESYVRGSNFSAIRHANDQVNRALCGAALSLGANIEIQDMPGYAPLRSCEGLMQIAEEAAYMVDAAESVKIGFLREDIMRPDSTDMGDLSVLMPTIQPYAPGASGKSHGTDYQIADPEKACVSSAKWQLAMLIQLLKGDAVRARCIIEEFKPEFSSKEEYFKYIESFESAGNRIVYQENGIASVKIGASRE